MLSPNDPAQWELARMSSANPESRVWEVLIDQLIKEAEAYLLHVIDLDNKDYL